MTSPIKGPSEADGLRVPVIAAYVRACEDTAYFRSLKGADDRRGFHQDLLSSLESLAQQLARRGAATALERDYLKCRRKRRGKSSAGSAFAFVRGAAPEECKRLELAAPLDAESLKKAYRAAALLHHPDRGGDTQTMRLVIESFATVHALLMDHSIGRDDESGESTDIDLHNARTSVEVRRILSGLLFQIHLDDWALTEALAWLDSYRATLRPAAKVRRSEGLEIQFEYGYLCRDAAKLASRLHHAGRDSESKQALDVARDAFAQGVQLIKILREGHIWGRDAFADYLKQGEQHVDGSRPFRVVINHRRQAEAAYRNGVIDRKRFASLTKRFDDRDGVDDQKAASLARFVEDVGFAASVTAAAGPTSSEFDDDRVPEPGYYLASLKWLSADQVAEYSATFAANADLARVRKYTYTRVEEVLRFVVLHDHLPGDLRATLGVLGQECALLDSVQTPRRTGGIALTASELLKWFAGRPEDDLRTRIRVLRELHESAPEDDGFGGAVFGVSFDDVLATDSEEAWGVCVSTDREWLDLARAPLDELMQMRPEGSVPRIAERESADGHTLSRGDDDDGSVPGAQE
jgi:hypothetical protein